MRLDIMLPYYGRVDHMKLAVESIVGQTDRDWRLVILDDGFPDESIPSWFASLNDDRIVYTRNDTNVGANVNYRRCLDRVEAEWFVMMGADDVMLPGYVARIKALISRFPEAGIIHPGVDVIDENGVVWKPLVERGKDLYRPRFRGDSKAFMGEEIALSLVRGAWMYFPSICWNTAAARSIGFRENLNVVQDLALVLDVVGSGKQLVLDREVVFHYRRHSQSDSSWRAVEGTRFLEEGEFLRSCADTFSARGWKRAARAARFHASSRLNALTFLPKALIQRNRTGIRNLVKHAFLR